MKIAVVGPSPIPYGRGGIENFLAGLHRTINDRTRHSAELIKVPVREDTVYQLLRGYWRFRRLELDHFDLVISVKYPAWMIHHRNHVLYLGHRLRGLYDTYPGDPARERLWRHSPLDLPGPWIRRLIHWLDHRAFDPERISHVYCTSRTIAARGEYFHPDMPPEVVYHSTAREDFYCRPAEHLFTVNRLDRPKRVDLLIRAYRRVPGETPLLLAGTGPQEAELRRLARSDPRVRLLGDVSEDQLLELYARSIGVPFIPEHEDYGLITIEAMKSGKPVVTLTDSGGPLEFVTHGETGLVAEPREEHLAEQLTRLLADPDEAAAMGDRARQRVASITWQATVERILEPYRHWPERGPRRSGERRRVLVLVPYPVDPPRSGGQRRVASIYHELARTYDVVLLTLGRHGEPGSSRELSPHLQEIRIPPSQIHGQRQWEYEERLGVAVSDVLLPELIHHTPNYGRAVRHLLDCSDLAVSSHPYLHPLLQRTERCRVLVHESHNFEGELKEASLGAHREGRDLAARVYRVEEQALQGADLICFTSRDEADGMSRRYGRPRGRIEIVPNGVDIREIQPAGPAERATARSRWELGEATTALFMGAWHPPNLEAFRFLLEQVAPALPEVRFLVVGSVRNQYEARVGPLEPPPNLIALGEVDEEIRTAALAASDVGLNPMFTGSGTNLKILEYFAAGLPVISTPLGVRGLAVHPGEHVLVGPPEEMARLLGELAESPEDRRRLAGAARTLVEQQYGWQRIAEPMLRAMEACLPPVEPADLSLENPRRFTWGWYGIESWPGPRQVCWSEPRAGLQLPDQRAPLRLSFQLQAGPAGGETAILLEGQELRRVTLGEGWQEVSLELPTRPGEDWYQLELVSPAWSPSETGSEDRRRLGVAISEVRLEVLE